MTTDEQWDGLRDALGRPEWSEDLSLDTYEGRRAMHDKIDEHLGQWCFLRSAAEIVEALVQADVPVGIVVLAHEVIDNPQLAARGWWTTVSHPVAGDEHHNGYPVRFSTGPSMIHRGHAPLLGEHNHEVLVELLGVSEEEYEQLLADDIIGTRP